MLKEKTRTVPVSAISAERHVQRHEITVPEYDSKRIGDVGFLTAMTLTLLGNYSQTGHFGGPLAYTPYVVTTHLIGPENGGLRYDYHRPKHPYSDRFMLAGGHNAPVTDNHPYHSGDLININVGADGRGSLITATNRVAITPDPPDRPTTRPLSIFDADGASIIVHALPDLYCPDPTNANCAGGGRVACGVFVPDE